MKIFKKLLPLQTATQQQPMHAGEVYHLWEGLTGGYKLIEMAETYLMNTEDRTLHATLKAITTGVFITKIMRLEKELKNEGFTVPPRPATKTLQGSPGAGHEVRLSDDEVIGNIVSYGQTYIAFNARAAMACTRDNLRDLFIDQLQHHMELQKMLVNLGKTRHSFNSPPPATARQDSLNISEVSLLWDELTARYVSQVNMETYLASTKDPDLINLIKWGLKEIVMPQMAKLEQTIKNEGLTVPPRPPVRKEQYTAGQVNKIKASDDETLGVLMLASQSAIILHVRGFITAFRKDILDLFESFIFKEFEGYGKMINLAKSRRVLKLPPIVSSLRI